MNGAEVHGGVLAGTDDGKLGGTDTGMLVSATESTQLVVDTGTDAGELGPVPLPPEASADLADVPGAYGQLEPSARPLVDDEGRVRLSFSRVETYQNCPAKFRFAYVEGLSVGANPYTSFGSSLHAALQRFYDQKLPACPSEEQLLRYLFEVWDSSGFEGMTREEQLVWYRHAQDVLRRFHARESGGYRLPADVEKWFELPFDDALVLGSIDRVDVDEHGRLEVIDYKTNKRVKDRAGVRSSLQLAIYALACEHLYGRLPQAVTLYFLVPGVQVRVPTDEMDFDAVRRAVAEVAASVREGRFAPSPNGLCGWCDFRAMCPAWDGDGPDVLGPAVEQLQDLRRRVRRDIRTLRQLEAGIERVRGELTGWSPPS